MAMRRTLAAKMTKVSKGSSQIKMG